MSADGSEHLEDRLACLAVGNISNVEEESEELDKNFIVASPKYWYVFVSLGMGDGVPTVPVVGLIVTVVHSAVVPRSVPSIVMFVPPSVRRRSLFSISMLYIFGARYEDVVANVDNVLERCESINTYH